MCAWGTHTFSPVIFQPSPARSATVCGSSAGVPISLRAAVNTVSPLTTPLSSSICSAVPNSAIGSAADTSVWINGSGATVRPCSWSSRHSSRNP